MLARATNSYSEEKNGETYRNQLTDLEAVTLSPNSLLICALGHATLSFQLCALLCRAQRHLRCLCDALEHRASIYLNSRQ